MEATNRRESQHGLSRLLLWLGIASIIFPAIALIGSPLSYAGPLGIFIWGFYHPLLYAPFVILLFVLSYVVGSRKPQEVEAVPESGTLDTHRSRRSSITLGIVGSVILIYSIPSLLTGLFSQTTPLPTRALYLLLLVGMISLIVYGLKPKRNRD